MKSRLLKCLIGALLALPCEMPVDAVYHEPKEGSRIYWDLSSRKMLFPSGNYARIIRLQDGRLIAVAEAGGGISVCYSNDNGSVWSSPERIIQSAPDIPYAVPDIIQLTNGDIVVGYNPRPREPHSTDRLFGIRCIRSTDNGKTWSAPIFIYDALHFNRQGCWEPCFLELPSGELQCYFANEKNFPDSNEQEISMCRSMDGGKTWGPESRICYSAGSRDGMPVPILTGNNEIVVIIEDNGWGGSYSGFRATTVRCPLEENWSNWVSRNSKSREMIFANAADKGFISAAPYIRRLGENETIASWQGDRGERKGMGEDRYEMSVGVGDADGRNVKAIVSPFGLPTNQHGLWNSVSALDDGTVFALTSLGDVGKGNAVYVMTGYARKRFDVAYGTPSIDASASKESWTTRNARQVLMGAGTTRNLATMDFLYDNKNLYFYARVVDRDIFTDKVDDDGITLAVDTENCSDTYPQKGMYRIFMDVNGSARLFEGNANKWTEITLPDEVEYAVNLKSSYYELEIAVPWSALGLKTPPVGKTMRCFLEVSDRKEGEILKEVVPESQLRQSWTWPEFRLLENADSSVKDILDASQPDNSLKINIDNGNVSVKSSRDIACVTLYTATGISVVSHRCHGQEASFAVPNLKGFYIVAVKFKDSTVNSSTIFIS